jgi:heavy metal translocating P-type ATPase
MVRWHDIFESREFRVPLAMAALLGFGFLTSWIWLGLLFTGLGVLLWESLERLRRGKWTLDYLAILTLFLALFLSEWLAGAIIALMAAVSAALETYGTRRAEKTLRGLFEAIPKTVRLATESGEHEVALQAVRPGDILVLRHGEMLPLEGRLCSREASVDLSSITGEPLPEIRRAGDSLKAGSVNVGAAVEIEALGDFEHSSYRRILSTVEEGKRHVAPFVRLSERANLLFTLFTLTFAGLCYVLFHDLERLLAIFVLATPCPLLIAVPLAYIGGLNRAARHQIIVKGPSVLERLAKTKALFFDKTGTLTLGEPVLRGVETLDKRLSEDEALRLASALERHSLHPLARAFVREAEARGLEALQAEAVRETPGTGIEGRILGLHFALRAAKGGGEGIRIDLFAGPKRAARFVFDDRLKPEVSEVFAYLKERGYRLGILTGDSKENAQRLLGAFHLPMYARATPEQKVSLIKRLRQEGLLVGMVGDGLNDAPALALADLGIVFSGTETSATTEAADVAILDRNVRRIRQAVHIGRRSYQVALQSMALGIGLSVGGMTLGFFGLIDPVTGAVLQELIDVSVIAGALRATY